MGDVGSESNLSISTSPGLDSGNCPPTKPARSSFKDKTQILVRESAFRSSGPPPFRIGVHHPGRCFRIIPVTCRRETLIRHAWETSECPTETRHKQRSVYKLTVRSLTRPERRVRRRRSEARAQRMGGFDESGTAAGYFIPNHSGTTPDRGTISVRISHRQGRQDRKDSPAHLNPEIHVESHFSG